MIVWDLDGTLANCEHRRHFVDPSKNDALCFEFDEVDSHGCPLSDKGSWHWAHNGEIWKPDWQAFYEACDRDIAIEPTIEIFINCVLSGRKVEIWSGRCESVREKTMIWIQRNLNSNFRLRSLCFDHADFKVKMRPIRDFTPDNILKELWLDEALAKGKKIDYVFDDRPNVVRMWRNRGIFVFNCCQHDEEF